MLQIDPGYLKTLQRLGLTTLAAIRNRFDPRTISPPSVEIVHTELELKDNPPLEVFYKQYNYRRPDWRFFGRPSKALCEFRNFAHLRGLGIQVADRIACGSWRDNLGRLQGAFILTRAVPQAKTLLEFWQKFCSDPSTDPARFLRDSLRRRVASMVQRMHHGHFFHNDLYWRNVLVTWQPPAEPELWWIDCPRGRFSRWRIFQRRHAMKDLAALDRWAHQLCTKEERLQFVHDYLGPETKTAEVNELAQETEAYRLRRWPQD